MSKDAKRDVQGFRHVTGKERVFSVHKKEFFGLLKPYDSKVNVPGVVTGRNGKIRKVFHHEDAFEALNNNSFGEKIRCLCPYHKNCFFQTPFGYFRLNWR